ncbi:MAG: serine dehydratase beta chain, partial [Gammaproteobacteria bacterium]
MTISVFNLFSIGIGPSSSHTVGPMKAAREFVVQLDKNQLLTQTKRVKVELFGSLAFTGKGHGTDVAILLGLEGNAPDTVNPDIIRPRAQEIITQQQIHLLAKQNVAFHLNTDFEFNLKDLLPAHTNGMRFSAYDQNDHIISSKVYYSIGGGFIIDEQQASMTPTIKDDSVPYPFSTTKELLEHCEKSHLSIREVMLANESSIRPAAEVIARIMQISEVMRDCIDKGCGTA